MELESGDDEGRLSANRMVGRKVALVFAMIPPPVGEVA